jgi:hypothetical protein
MPESEDQEKASNNDLRNAQFGGGFINAENVKAQRIGGDIWNIDQQIIVITDRKELVLNSTDKGLVLKEALLKKHPSLYSVSKPVKMLPRNLNRPLLNRQDEVKRVIEAFNTSERLIEFYGPKELGKTTLLRYFAYHPLTDTLCPDKILYLCAHNKSLEDLLQSFCEFFCETDSESEVNSFFSPNKIREALRETQAIVLLDDVNMPRKDLEELINALPHILHLEI